MVTRRGAWIRYQDPLSDEQLDFAVEHYQVAILQPWEDEAAARLKEQRPDMTVLAYRCLSSVRDFETGPVYTSGVSLEEAEEAGEEWFAHREDGARIQWATYPGHWQMAVWEPDYRERWCDNAADFLEDTPWDGLMADNDVYDDYYGLRPPLEGGRTMADLRRTMDEFVPQAGKRLNEMGKLLVPNIAESRRDPGRWARHAAYGGGFEEVFLAWGPGDFLDPGSALAQMDELAGPGLTIVRTATDGRDDHPNFLYGLAALMVFGPEERAYYSATDHDGYSGTPFRPELEWDLGAPLGRPQQRGNAWSREFESGWAGVNLNENKRRKVTLAVPPGLRTAGGEPAPARVTLQPHEGAVYRR
ncbi:putative glycoside hydrolase [Geodermatophilus sp. SYSU D00684]